MIGKPLGVLKSLLLLLAFTCSNVVWADTQTTGNDPIQNYDICARGINRSAEKPFTHTMRVRLSVRGPALDERLLKNFAAQLVRSTLWVGKAEEVFVEKYDPSECAASAGAESEINVNVTQNDIDEFKAQVDRGSGIIEKITELAKNAELSTSLASTTSEEQKHWLRIFYAANRNGTGATAVATAFGSKRSDALSYGSVDVAVRHDRRMQDNVSPAVFRFEKATNLDSFEVASQIVPLTRNAWLEELRRRASRFEQPGVLLFIHGYNVTFVDAARRAAQLAYDLAFPGPTVFFAWPSDASVIKYLYDGREAGNSKLAAASVLSDVAGLLPAGPVYVVAHSMGNRIMMGALLELLSLDPAKRRAIREVVMAAPDVDQDDFRINFAPKILAAGPRFTLYASKHDLALGSSQFLQGGKRLGVGGSVLYVSTGMDSVDASAVTKEFFAMNHSYFGDKTTVLGDLFYLIRGQLPPSKRPHLKPLSQPTGSAWELE